MTDLVREASFPDFRDALREVWPDLPDGAVERAWKLYHARLKRQAAPNLLVPRISVTAMQYAFSKRDLPIKADQAHELAIEILKGWS